MAKSANGDTMKELRFNNDFRTISPQEYVEEGTLVWIERFRNAYYDVEVKGPFIIEEGWGPVWFGPKNQNNPIAKEYVKLVSTINGEVEYVTHGSFSHQSFYVINEEKLCTNAET